MKEEQQETGGNRRRETDGTMPRVDAVCAHPLWKECVQKIAELEETRIFCRHDPVHFLDVARLAQIENLERGLGLEKERIYAAALLHDIGRHLQYEQGLAHDQGSRILAERILPDCGYSREEQEEILEAIGAHREMRTGKLDTLAGVLYRADKRSRMCLFCKAQTECDWPEEKKNRKIRA